MAGIRCELLNWKGSNTMPKTPRTTDGEAPKKRARKSTTEAGTATKVVKEVKAAPKTSSVKAAKSEPMAVPLAVEATTPVVPAVKREVAQMPSKEVSHQPSLEERVRNRAYELYLRRGGRGGSPEQDWFQAMSEIYGESVA